MEHGGQWNLKKTVWDEETQVQGEKENNQDLLAPDEGQKRLWCNTLLSYEGGQT